MKWLAALVFIFSGCASNHKSRACIGAWMAENPVTSHVVVVVDDVRCSNS